MRGEGLTHRRIHNTSEWTPSIKPKLGVSLKLQPKSLNIDFLRRTRKPRHLTDNEDHAELIDSGDTENELINVEVGEDAHWHAVLPRDISENELGAKVGIDGLHPRANPVIP
ncbi:Uncharacterized protein HZ326_6934 [Fusarium oxysporum f. sp. albedinis]|nr:Uncharacterized protein HZ326_6934 [Fusarium oxysporum f. sp. albedinis]